MSNTDKLPLLPKGGSVTAPLKKNIEPERTIIKCGSLEIDVSQYGFGMFKIDGVDHPRITKAVITILPGLDHVKAELTMLP